MKSENPLPAPGGIVYCLGAWPGARPARQRPRCNLLGELRFARCCGREWRGRAGGGARGPSAGQTTPLGRGAPRSSRHRRSPPPRAQTRPEEGVCAPCSRPQLPSLPHPHPRSPKRKEGGGRERPPLRLEGVCAPPAAAAAARRAGGGSNAGLRRRRRVWSCFWTAFSSWGKKTFVSRYKKGGVGEKELKKNSKAQTGTLVCKVD